MPVPPPFAAEPAVATGRPTRAEVDLGQLAANLRAIRRRIGAAVEVMATVKADGYGHGAVPSARTFLSAGATHLAVAIPEEGAALRAAGIGAPILSLTAPLAAQAALYAAHDLACSPSDADTARALSAAAVEAGRTVSVHLKLDTGMGRVGVQPDDALAFAAFLSRLDGLRLDGLMTHFSTSDEADPAFARLQLGRFGSVRRALAERGIRPTRVHAANSGAILSLPESHYGLVRPGILLYGSYPSADVVRSVKVAPVLRLRSVVGLVKTVPAGTPVSYGRHYVTSRETVLATIPVGYGDGYRRGLTDKAWVAIDGRRCPVAGRVCMDQIVVDCGPGATVRPGDEVDLIGGAGPSIAQVADWLDTIPYEITTALTARVPRVYLNGMTE